MGLYAKHRTRVKRAGVSHTHQQHQQRQQRQQPPNRGGPLPDLPQDMITLHDGPRVATRDSMLHCIRENDALMRTFGCDIVQRAYIHSGARMEMYGACQTDADYRLWQDAWKIAIEEGIVPLAEDAMRFIEAHPGYASPMIDQERIATASDRLARELRDGEGATP